MKKLPTHRTCINVMETLVLEEVERQLGRLPSKAASFLKAEEVLAYALNQLRPLYASSMQGIEWQHQRAGQLLKDIEVAVRQGMAAVQRDPLRVTQPLQFEDNPKADRALGMMRYILQQPDLDWDTLPAAVEQALSLAAKGETTWRSRAELLAPAVRRYDIRTGKVRSS